MAQGRVPTLQEAQGGFDGLGIAVEVVQELVDRRAALRFGQGQGASSELAQALGTEQFEHQFQGQVVLARIDATRAQKTGQVSAGGVGGVELRHGRNQAEHPKFLCHGGRCVHSAATQARANASPTLMPSTAADKMPPA